MILYHGSYTEIKVPQILTGKYAKDFGKGFYEYQENNSLQTRDFLEMTEEWLDLQGA